MQNFERYMIYFGDYAGNERSGFGLWYHALDRYQEYFSRGEWRNDSPNGAFEVDTGYTHWMGTVLNGLWHGEVVVYDRYDIDDITLIAFFSNDLHYYDDFFVYTYSNGLILDRTQYFFGGSHTQNREDFRDDYQIEPYGIVGFGVFVPIF